MQVTKLSQVAVLFPPLNCKDVNCLCRTGTHTLELPRSRTARTTGPRESPVSRASAHRPPRLSTTTTAGIRGLCASRRAKLQLTTRPVSSYNTLLAARRRPVSLRDAPECVRTSLSCGFASAQTDHAGPRNGADTPLLLTRNATASN